MGFVNSVLRKVFDVIARDRTMNSKVKRGLGVLKREMSMVACEIESNEEKNQGATHESKIVLLRDLACEIEDFIDYMGSRERLWLCPLGVWDGPPNWNPSKHRPFQGQYPGCSELAT